MCMTWKMRNLTHCQWACEVRYTKRKEWKKNFIQHNKSNCLCICAYRSSNQTQSWITELLWLHTEHARHLLLWNTHTLNPYCPICWDHIRTQREQRTKKKRKSKLLYLLIGHHKWWHSQKMFRLPQYSFSNRIQDPLY